MAVAARTFATCLLVGLIAVGASTLHPRGKDVRVPDDGTFSLSASATATYGYPFVFAESELPIGWLPREGWDDPPANFNPWEDPTEFDGRAFLASWAAWALAGLLLVETVHRIRRREMMAA